MDYKEMAFDEKPNLNFELAKLNSKRQFYFSELHELYELSKHSDDKFKALDFLTKYKALENIKEKIFELTELINDTSFKLNPNFTPNYQVWKTVEDLKQKIEAAATAASEPVKEVQPIFFRLPEIPLPEFAGDILEWPMFFQKFTNLIHNNPRLDNLSKLHYLLSALKGKALDVCAGIVLDPSNYELLLETLISKFDNKRFLADSYFHKMVHLQPLLTESATSLSQLVFQFDTAYKSLSQLDIPNLMNYCTALLILDKLDPQTRREYETSEHSKFPSYPEVLSFLQNHIEAISRSSKSNNNQRHLHLKNSIQKKESHTFVSRTQRCMNQTETVISCPVCTDSHLIYKCKLFIRLKTPNRLELVKDKKLCVNCLSNKHFLKSCESLNRCKVCQKKHHTLLHSDDYIGNICSKQPQNFYNIRQFNHVHDQSIVSDTLAPDSNTICTFKNNKNPTTAFNLETTTTSELTLETSKATNVDYSGTKPLTSGFGTTTKTGFVNTSGSTNLFGGSNSALVSTLKPTINFFWGNTSLMSSQPPTSEAQQNEPQRYEEKLKKKEQHKIQNYDHESLETNTNTLNNYSYEINSRTPNYNTHSNSDSQTKPISLFQLTQRCSSPNQIQLFSYDHTENTTYSQTEKNEKNLPVSSEAIATTVSVTGSTDSPLLSPLTQSEVPAENLFGSSVGTDTATSALASSLTSLTQQKQTVSQHDENIACGQTEEIEKKSPVPSGAITTTVSVSGSTNSSPLSPLTQSEVPAKNLFGFSIGTNTTTSSLASSLTKLGQQQQSASQHVKNNAWNPTEKSERNFAVSSGVVTTTVSVTDSTNASLNNPLTQSQVVERNSFGSSLRTNTVSSAFANNLTNSVQQQQGVPQRMENNAWSQKNKNEQDWPLLSGVTATSIPVTNSRNHLQEIQEIRKQEILRLLLTQSQVPARNLFGPSVGTNITSGDFTNNLRNSVQQQQGVSYQVENNVWSQTKKNEGNWPVSSGVTTTTVSAIGSTHALLHHPLAQSQVPVRNSFGFSMGTNTPSNAFVSSLANLAQQQQGAPQHLENNVWSQTKKNEGNWPVSSGATTTTVSAIGSTHALLHHPLAQSQVPARNSFGYSVGKNTGNSAFASSFTYSAPHFQVPQSAQQVANSSNNVNLQSFKKNIFQYSTYNNRSQYPKY